MQSSDNIEILPTLVCAGLWLGCFCPGSRYMRVFVNFRKMDEWNCFSSLKDKELVYVPWVLQKVLKTHEPMIQNHKGHKMYLKTIK